MKSTITQFFWKIKHYVGILLFLLVSSFVAGQNAGYTVQGKLVQAGQAKSKIDPMLRNYQVMEIDIAALNEYCTSLENKNPLLKFQLGALTGAEVQLYYSPLQKKDLKVRYQTDKGIEVIDAPDPLFFKGQDIHNTNAKSILTIDFDFMLGYVELGEERFYIEPLFDFLPGSPINQFVIYKQSDVVPLKGNFCAAAEHVHKSQEVEGNIEKNNYNQVERGVACCFEMELAMAADGLDLNKYQSIFPLIKHHESIVKLTEGDYTGNFQCDLVIIVVEWYISQVGGDPWPATTDAEQLLIAFAGWGNSGGFMQEFDCGQLWTSRTLDNGIVGIAFLGSICTGGRYHVISNYTTNNELLRVVMSHELGHNFNGTHDPPGTPTIMAPVVNNTKKWSIMSINEISLFMNTCWCLKPCGAIGFPPEADFTWNPSIGCAPLTVQFTDNSINNPSAWFWNIPGATPTLFKAKDPIVTFLVPGVYDVSLAVLNPWGKDSITKKAIITVLGKPTADFSFVKNALTINFFDQSKDATAWEWNFGDDNTSTDQNPVHTYAEEGVYKVTLKVTNQCGTSIISKTFAHYIPPVADFVADPDKGCAPLTVIFTNMTTGTKTGYQWQFPGGNPTASSQQDPVVVYNNPGTYTVILTANGPGGANTMTKTKYIVVRGVPTAAFNTNIDPYNKVKFNNTSIDGDEYVWDFGDGKSSEDKSPNHIYSAPGKYAVKLTTKNPCGTAVVWDTIKIIFPPLANFSSDKVVVCTGSYVNYSDLSLNDPDTWFWQFEGGSPSTSNEKNPTILYSTPGIYQVSLNVSNASGNNSKVVQQYIEVQQGPLSAFTFNISNNVDVQFNNTSQNSNTYFWDFGDNGTSTSQNPQHTFPGGGSYTVKLISTNSCGSDTSEQIVLIPLAPEAAISADVTSGCQPLVVHYTDLSTNNPTSWEWTFEGGTPGTSTLKSPIVTYNTPGTYDVKLVATNGSGSGQVTWTKKIKVNAFPNAAFTSSQVGQSLILNNTSTDKVSQIWYFGDGNTSTDESPTHTYSTAGTFTVTLAVTNPCGTDSTSIQITVSGSAPQADFKSNTNSGCVPLTVKFSDNSLGAPTSWSWTFAGGNPATSTAQNPSVLYGSSGTYGVTLTATNAFGSDVETKTSFIEVKAGPLAGYTYTSNGLAINFQNTSTNSTSYEWDFGDGQKSTEINPVHTFSGNGTYTVILTAKNDCGTNTYTVVLILSGTENEDPRFRFVVEPNPGDGNFFVDLTSPEEGQLLIEVMDIQSKVITMQEHSIVNGKNLIPFNLSQFASGTYILRAALGDHNWIRKVIKY